MTISSTIRLIRGGKSKNKRSKMKTKKNKKNKKKAGDESGLS
jgi:hypothetical protein